jgi:hypothetical protein
MVFGKRLGEYVRFERSVLLLTVVVGVLRLVLSLAGLPNSTVKWLSMTVVILASALYFGVRVHQTGFGSYKHILPLLVVQGGVANLIVIVGILISAATGQPNVFTAPEYGGQINVAGHVAGHVVFGLVIGPVVLWLIACLVMWVTKKVSGARPAIA